VRRVRVFFDGLELKSIDPRTGGVLDLTQINLWSAEDATVEQTADEIRVYLRSWRVRNTHTETRTDVNTGDQQTNLYRAFFGRRFDNSTAIQFGAQQYGTTPPSVFGTSSDQTGLVVRLGWAKTDWSVDAFATRISRHRGSIFGESSEGLVGSSTNDSIPGVGSTRSDAYLRVAYRDPDVSPVWAQIMAVGSKYDYTGIRTVKTTGLTTHQDSVLAVGERQTRADASDEAAEWCTEAAQPLQAGRHVRQQPRGELGHLAALLIGRAEGPRGQGLGVGRAEHRHADRIRPQQARTVRRPQPRRRRTGGVNRQPGVVYPSQLEFRVVHRHVMVKVRMPKESLSEGALARIALIFG